jgi:hypothetical protein
MKKDLIDTIMEKEFHALTEVERTELASFCSSEEEYNQMKDVFIGVEQLTAEQSIPKTETKQRLDDLFNSTYPKAAPVWYDSVLIAVVPKGKPIYRQPLAQIAAIALIAILIVPFWNSSDVAGTSTQFAQATETVVVPYSGGRSADVSSLPTNDLQPAENEVKTDLSQENPVVVALAPVKGFMSSEPSVSRELTASASVPGSTHPDGVFVAVSQPASDSPEMFDLLTATF